MSSEGPLTPGPAPVGPEGGDDGPGAEEAARPAGGERDGRSGLAAVLGPDFSVAQALGGPRGIVEAVLPSVVFVVAFPLTRDLGTSIVAALVAAALTAVARLVGRQSPMQALAGLVGVAVCAVVAWRTGDARDFYLPGLLTNVGYAAVYALSTLRTPAVPALRLPAGPWPALGLALGFLTGEGLAWKHDPRRLRAYVTVTWIWVGLFVLRLAVQVPLYLLGEVAALGAARLAMGFPAFGLAAWMTWRVVRSVPLAEPAGGTDRGGAADA